MVSFESWGRRRRDGHLVAGEDLARCGVDARFARGLGRAYGDANLPAAADDVVISTVGADRVLSLDLESRRIRAEAGISLETLNQLLWPRGLTVPVSPGTQYVTLGGMVAADVHGKNHHLAGTLGRHVRELTLLTPADGLCTVSPMLDPELFWATVGGMGLTGVITEVELELQAISSAWVRCHTSRHPDLDSLCTALIEAGKVWPKTAAWLDAANGGVWGRGVVLAGRWASADEAPVGVPPKRGRVSVPVDPPNWLLNDPGIGVFDRLYYRKAPRRPTEAIQHPDTFFYPLDIVHGWNRLYGRRGFVQYQCVTPAEHGIAGVRRVLDALRNAGGRSYLVVLKDFGEQGEGLLSFPLRGFTLALDLPNDRRLPHIAKTLDAEVLALGGRLYLAKDALLDATTFRAMEGDRVERFLEVRRRVDPTNQLRTALSARLEL